jgi:hypothetical protein
VILFASSRYLLIQRILGYFWDIKFKSVAFGKIPQNDHKTIFPKKIFDSKKISPIQQEHQLRDVLADDKYKVMNKPFTLPATFR